MQIILLWATSKNRLLLLHLLLCPPSFPPSSPPLLLSPSLPIYFFLFYFFTGIHERDHPITRKVERIHQRLRGRDADGVLHQPHHRVSPDPQDDQQAERGHLREDQRSILSLLLPSLLPSFLSLLFPLPIPPPLFSSSSSSLIDRSYRTPTSCDQVSTSKMAKNIFP